MHIYIHICAAVTPESSLTYPQNVLFSRCNFGIADRENEELSHAGKKAKPVLVVMLGGCTFAEMTALKAALHKKHGLKPIILTSDILTGDRFINTFIPSSTKLAAADALATMTSL